MSLYQIERILLIANVMYGMYHIVSHKERTTWNYLSRTLFAGHSVVASYFTYRVSQLETVNDPL